jgi:hypothetical protein
LTARWLRSPGPSATAPRTTSVSGRGVPQEDPRSVQKRYASGQTRTPVRRRASRCLAPSPARTTEPGLRATPMRPSAFDDRRDAAHRPEMVGTQEPLLDELLASLALPSIRWAIEIAPGRSSSRSSGRRH